MKRLAPIVALFTLLWTITAATAQGPDKVQGLVYAVSAFDGRAYKGLSYPPTEDTIYLIANRDNVLAPRATLVYFWAITSEYLADWESLNEPIQATLEVLQGDQVVANRTKEKFVLVYSQGYLSESNQLYVGDAAVQQEEQYNELIASYLRQVDAVFLKNQQYQRDVEAYLKQRNEGGQSTPPIPPDQPAFPSIQITPLDEAFILNLPEGVYQLRLRDADGRVLADTTRRLVVFAARREGVSYNIIPANRWTRPEHSNASAEIVYGRGAATLYMQPFLAQEYNDFYYTKLLKPQSSGGREDRWQWIPTTPLTDGRVEVVSGDGVAVASTYKPHVVRQLPGTALGYEIVELDPSAEQRSPPTFRAFRVDLDLSARPYSLRWVDSHGTVHPMSLRELRPLRTDTVATLYLLSAYPLILGSILLAWRWRTTRRPTGSTE